jgi:hypothetical protein
MDPTAEGLGRRRKCLTSACALLGALAVGVVAPSPAAAGDAGAPTIVHNESELRSAWADPRNKGIELADDIFLRSCKTGEPIRESARPMTLDGNGHTIRQTCFEKRLLRQDGTGFLMIKHVALTRGGNDGPGAAVTSRGEIELRDSRVTENLSEEPGGGIFSMRRITVHRSVLTGNLANDDGGALYARRGGVQVYDSIVSGNLVDGSGGAIGSTGDILVVNSHVDGNTTDGDGGALYTDEDGDITVINSTVDGSTADGPGGAIFTLEGDVTIVNSTLNGNRADDRGGAISGEADVTVIGSTIDRNAAVAHVGGGIWARSDLFITNSTISNNYAEGEGGGLFAAGRLGLVDSTVVDNVAPVAASIGGGEELMAFGSIIGPPNVEPFGGQVQPTETNCRVSASQSGGYNFASDDSCGLDRATDVVNGPNPMLGGQHDNGGFGETRMPAAGSPVLDRVPVDRCRVKPFGYSYEGEQHLDQFGIDPLARVTTDQRLARRPYGGACDVGAVERGAVPPVLAPGPTMRLTVPDVAKAPPPRPSRAAPKSETPALSAKRRATSRTRLGRVRVQMRAIARMLKPMERSTRNFHQWMRCVSEVPVSEYGDPDHRFGYAYDEKNGTGLDRRPALAIDERARHPDYRFLKFSRRKGCDSATTVPGGTADNARPIIAKRAAAGGLGALERRLVALEDRADVVERGAARFDEYESCLSWVPVTEYGDPDGQYGYIYGSEGAALGYRPALAIDISEWDDPDYEFLAFIGRDRPFVQRECGHEPGEGVDKPLIRARAASSSTEQSSAATRRDRIVDIAQDLHSLKEDVEDLVDPTDEFAFFDQCMFTIGVSAYGIRGGDVGYAYGDHGRRSALAMDMRGFDPAQYDLLAFPGEEPPQIECNEDASGQGTDE